MIVFRIQDKLGRGPWKLGFSYKWVENREDHSNLLPWYEEFGRIDLQAIPGMQLGCACTSEEQLRRWFLKSEYEKLIERGYAAVKFEADVLAKSNIQCFIQRDKPFNINLEIIKLYDISF